MKKALSFIIAVLFVLSCAAGCNGETVQTGTDTDIKTDAETTAPGTEAVTTEEIPEYRAGSDVVLPEYDTEDKVMKTVKTINFKGSESFSDFALYSDGKVSGASVVMPAKTVAGVYPLQTASEDSESEYSFVLNCAAPSSDSTWTTFYLGLRLTSSAKDPTGHSCVWIAMRSDQIGIRKGNWPGDGYMNADWDLSKGERVTVVDDPTGNIIKVYAGEEKRPIAEVKIDGKKIGLYAPGADSPSVTDTVEQDVIKGGYVHLWNHHTPCDVTVDELSVTTSVLSVEKADRSGIKPNTRDVFADTYVTTDDAGRVIDYSGKKPNGAKVGIFYFLWHESNGPLYDHTASYEKGGMDELWKTMQSGNLGFAHYWAEPYFGYYRSNDEWIIRKHGAMLSEAGVDFVYFDTTNGLLYRNCYEAVLKVWSEMRKEGFKTPDVCFLMQNENQKELSQLWNDLYGAGLYSDMWFVWDGKPVIMFTGSGTKLSKEQEDFFTVRISWANESDDWYRKTKGVGCWSWGTMYPQKGGYVMEDGAKKLEQMVVMCGFWVNGSYGTNAGRSYTKKTGEPKNLSEGDWNMGFGLYPQTSGLGLAYQEQFDNAIKKAPKLVMITGWNEWWAGRWEGAPATGQTIAGQYTVVDDKKKKENNYFVDNLNPEYSRDIEPMKGGYGDNYYYQTVMNVRAYKGSRPVEAAFGQRSIEMNGDEVQWYGVGPEFRDVYGDTAHRDFSSHVGGFQYKNDTGRNDILTAKVSYDGENLYFYVECAENIKLDDGAEFMNLFIKSDDKEDTGWYGFDYVINRSRDGKKAAVEKFKDGWTTEKVGEAEYVISGKTMTVKVSAALVGYNKETLDFKWADNSVDDGDIMGFWDKGDAAPDGRFCYRYTTKSEQAAVPDCLTSDMAVFKANGYNAYINGEAVRLEKYNTKATLLASGTQFWLPVSTMEKLGIKTDGLTILDHYGVKYVKADEAVKSAGKVVTTTKTGLLVIADKEITDTEALDTLYDSLY